MSSSYHNETQKIKFFTVNCLSPLLNLQAAAKLCKLLPDQKKQVRKKRGKKQREKKLIEGKERDGKNPATFFFYHQTLLLLLLLPSNN
jgi:hypothetical protein